MCPERHLMLRSRCRQSCSLRKSRQSHHSPSRSPLTEHSCQSPHSPQQSRCSSTSYQYSIKIMSTPCHSNNTTSILPKEGTLVTDHATDGQPNSLLYNTTANHEAGNQSHNCIDQPWSTGKHYPLEPWQQDFPLKGYESPATPKGVLEPTTQSWISHDRTSHCVINNRYIFAV